MATAKRKSVHSTKGVTQAAPNTNVENGLASKHYLASPDEVATLARSYVDSSGRVGHVRASYLRVLVAHAKALLIDAVGGPRRVARATVEAQQEALRDADARLYAIVQEAVIGRELALTDDLPTDERRKRVLERNRRTNFARTAKTTLARFIDRGGNLATVNPDTATKTQLTAGSTSPVTMADKAKAAAQRFERLIKRLAREGDKEYASELVEHILDTLAPVVGENAGPPARVVRMTPDTSHAASPGH